MQNPAIGNRRPLARIAGGVAAAVLLLGGDAGTEPARAASPADPPVFSAPLEITNPYLPFVPGAVSVYSGRAGAVPVTLVETHLVETREFLWNGTRVACCVIESLDFERGALTGRERRFLAQADDGAVWTFGEVEDDADDPGGDDPDPNNGWIVGLLAPGDPPDVIAGAEPAIVMPASPQAGDEWTSEFVPPTIVTTTRARSTRAAVLVGAGKFTGCLRVVEDDVPAATSETRWFAPGYGLVRTEARSDRLALRATTIRAQR